MPLRLHPGPCRTALRVTFGAILVGMLVSGSSLATPPPQPFETWAGAPAAVDPALTLRDYGVRLRSALLTLERSPPPLVLKANVTAESRTGVRRLRIRGFQLLSDGARATAEYDLGPGSWPTMVGVLGSAVAQEFLVQAALRGVPVDALDVEFTSRPGAAPASRSATRVTYPRNLGYTAHIVSPATDATLDELRQAVARHSPVLALVGEEQNIPHGELIYTRTPSRRAAASLEGLREFLAEKRAASRGAKPPEPPSRFAPQPVRVAGEPPLRAHVTVDPATGIRRIRTDAGKFQFLHDNPRQLAGSDLAPTAEEHVLGVMITCLAHIYEIQAAVREVVLDTLELEVEATLRPRSAGGVGAARYQDLRYKVYIGSPEPKERIEELQRAVEASCPIYNMLKDAQEIQARVVRGPFRDESRRTASD